MSPPPVTPSPRRFILNKPRPSQQKTAFSNTQSHSHFNATPRFSVSSSRQTPFLTQTPAPSRRFEEIVDDDTSDLDQDVRESIETVDGIEDVAGQWIEEGDAGLEEEEDEYDYEFLDRSLKRRRLESAEDEGHDAEMLETSHEAVNEHTTVTNEQGQQLRQEEEEFDDLLSSQPALPILSSPPRPNKDATSHRPSTSASSAHKNAPPRFILPSTPSAAVPHLSSTHLHPQDPSSTPITAQTPAPSTGTTHGPFHKPPRFLPHADQNISSGNSSHDPLPEAFSPHRRGQKFLVGGLASEVRGWVMGLENASAPSSSVFANSMLDTSSRSADGKIEEWMFKLAVEEVTGGSGSGAGMTLVRGRMVLAANASSNGSNPRELKVILAGEGTGEGVQRPKRAVLGSTVGVKGPVWEVTIQGERWGVAVDWKVIS